jgi:predicted ATPase/DNA-binding SARP family transcriptional activator
MDKRSNLADDQSCITIQLLGGFSVSVNGRSIPAERWRLRKVKQLVKLLALAPGHRIHREQLLDLLWPDSDFKAAANMLYQTVHAVRRAVELENTANHNILVLQNEQLILCPDSPLIIDVEQFEACSAQARSTADPALYNQALDLYTGDLLPEDLYEDWAVPRRAALRQTYLDLLVELSDLHESQREFVPAISALQKAITADPAYEDAHVRLMHLFTVSGQRQQALRQYQALKDALRRELDAEPDSAAVNLYNEILSGKITPEISSVRFISGSRPRHNLPAHLTSFIGRENEIQHAVHLLSVSRLVTLTGVGGTGKTRLSLKIAEQLIEHFSDGVWFIEFAPITNPELLSRTVAAVLELQESNAAKVQTHLQEYLREKEILLVLDNCEHLITEIARLVETLLHACPKLKILASSRETLAITGEVSFSVPSLSTPKHNLLSYAVLKESEAVRLFLERAAVIQPGFTLTPDNAPIIASICSQLDGIPLAIELAAVRVGMLNLEQIAERLTDRFRLLTGGSRNAMPRQQTLRASIDWSYSLLLDRERMLLQRLSVFAGGWTLSVAETVCGFNGLEDIEVLDCLTQLVHKSLVILNTQDTSEQRYSMLETIRQYASEQLQSAGEDHEVRERHLDAFLQLAEEAKPNLRAHKQVIWMDRLVLEIDNLRTAIDWSIKEEPLKGLKLSAALLWFWHIRDYQAEATAQLEQLLESINDHLPLGPQTPDEQLAIADGMGVLGLLYVLLGQLETRTTQILEQSLMMYEKLGSAGKSGKSMVLHAMYMDSLWRGETNKAFQLAEEDLALSEELNDKFRIAEALTAFSLENMKDASKVKDFAERAISLRRELGDVDGLMTALGHRGNLLYRLGDFEHALADAEESLQIAERVRDSTGIQFSLFLKGMILYESGHPYDGMKFIQQASEINREIGWLYWSSICLSAAGNMANLLGDPIRAEQYLDEALATARLYGEKNSTVVPLFSLGEAAWGRGNLELARQRYLEAASAGQGSVHPNTNRLVLYAMGKASYLSGDLASANQYFRQALKLALHQHNSRDVIHYLEALAVVAAREPETTRKAAILLGVTQSEQQHIPVRDWYGEVYYHAFNREEIIDQIRETLNEEQITHSLTEGQSIDLRTACSFALDD